MSVFRSGQEAPAWCELRHFDVVQPALGTDIHYVRQCPRERIFVSQGRCNVSIDGRESVLRAGQYLDIPDDVTEWSASATTADAELLRLAGTWGDEIAGCGVWTIENSDNPTDKGDSVDYPKHTRMDSHYHDYDEYWFVIDGAATAVVSGKSEKLKAGDCLCIGMGHHHDMPDVEGVMRGAFFETTVLGQKRLGHLWNHTHGQARPEPDRV